MADSTVVAVDPPSEPHSELADFDSGLHVPPLDAAFFSEDLFNGDDAMGDDQNDDVVVLDDLDFDFSFDDLALPSSYDLDHLLNPTQLQQFNCQPGAASNFVRSAPSFGQLDGAFKSTAAELRHLSGDGDFSKDQSWDGSGLLNSASPDTESPQISTYLNMQSPESNGSNRGSSENCGVGGKELNCGSPESQGSGNFDSNVSVDSNNFASRSVSSSPISSNSSVKTSVVDQKIKLEKPANNNSNMSLLKRKKEGEDLKYNSVESRINKFRKSNCSAEEDNSRENNDELSEEDEKRKARLLRNRESAQLSRQRKKHYVEELEDKVRSMHSTIQDLNGKISYFMAENATLRQQMGGGGAGAGGGGGGAAVPPPPMVPPPPGMYTHPAMMYPWMPYAPPYMMKSQGSQVPLVPIPRLKPQQPTQAPKTSKKADSKKNEGPKTKKVAGVSFLGLLFFIMLFGGLVPMVNVKYGGTREAFTGGESYIGGGFNEKHRGRVLMVNGTEYDEKLGGRRDFTSDSSGQKGHGSRGEPSADEFVQSGNGSEPLAASLYVPRNDKLVKIDGNLIIHSVLASEKAMASKGKGQGGTGLVVPGDLAPAIPGPGVGRNGARHPILRALGSGSVDKDGMKSTATDGRLQQWFREGLAGPMLSAGMCTEVFQFDVSAASASGAIVPATASRNISEEQNKNSTHPSKTRNRRILHPIPIPNSSHNISGKHDGRRTEKEELNIKNKTSSMVVSVLFDPREGGDADVDGVMGPKKSLSRIFVVVLIDSVKYVTYSCMLPFKGTAPHLVTT